MNEKISNSSAVLAGGARPAPEGYCTVTNLLLVWVYCSAGLRISSSAASLDVDMLKKKTPYSTTSQGGTLLLLKQEELLLSSI